MNSPLKILFFLITLVLLVYVSLPEPVFPKPPPDSIQSMEDADVESTLKRAYFTNYDRAQVLDYYQKQFEKTSFMNLNLPTLRLNYPPEESQTLIRDQTRSTFLQELTHPLRESLFINGFEPKQAKDEIWYKGQHFRQKIIIKYNPSNLFIRFAVVILSSFSVVILLSEWRKTIKWIFQS